MITGTVIGNIGREPRLRELESGAKVVDFPVAVNRRNGSTEWYTVKAWNGLGEKVVMPYVRKGDQIAVNFNEVILEEWTSAEGEPRRALVLRANDIKLLNNRRTSDDQPDF